MKLVCGLGNPGREYERHRHNAGFMAADALVARWNAPSWNSKFESVVSFANYAGERILIQNPQTLMNLSGLALAKAANFYKIDVADVLVLHDELDFPFGKTGFKRNGGSAGHRGLESIIASWGHSNFVRLRIGVGRPEGTTSASVVQHVLGDFSDSERTLLPEILTRATEMCDAWLRFGLRTAMNRYN